LLSGATLYIPERFDPLSLLTALEKHQLTIMLGVPGMYALLVEYAKINAIRSFNFPSLRIISSSGAQLDAELKRSVEKLFELVLHNAYGVTECSPTIAQTRIEEPRSDTSVGRISPYVEVRLIGPDGNRVEEGAVGELSVRGPNLMKGYYRAPAETAAAIDSEGWFNTRDLARLERGNLFIVGRTKELIVRFGFNVYPGEVEAVLNCHPAVARSAVIGRSVDSRNGDEQIIAFVQTVSGSNVTAADLSKFARRNLVSYKHPSHILLVGDMPLTPTGKIAKRELTKLDVFRNLSRDGF
jgi:long-chain acyl-CoA synthetase